MHLRGTQGANGYLVEAFDNEGKRTGAIMLSGAGQPENSAQAWIERIKGRIDADARYDVIGALPLLRLKARERCDGDVEKADDLVCRVLSVAIVDASYRVSHSDVQAWLLTLLEEQADVLAY